MTRERIEQAKRYVESGQADLFVPVPCPCGEIPEVQEDPDGVSVFNWCCCVELWFVFAATQAEAFEKWARLMGEVK